MEELNVSPVNAGPVENVDPQPVEPVQTNNVDPVDPQQSSKPVQTPEQNAEFARVRREAETKAKDQMIEEMYGESHGIHTYADYQKAIAEQKAEEQRQQFQQENGFDPNVVKPLFEDWLKQDPRYQRLESMEQDAKINNAVSEFSKEFPDLGVKSFEDIQKLPNVDKVTQYVSRGMTLNEAYKLANYSDLINKTSQSVEQNTIKKIMANGESSPGSLANHGTEETFFTKEQVEKMSKDEVRKNYEKICKSTAKW